MLTVQERYPVLADCLWRYASVEAPELWPLLRTRYEEEHSSRAFHETLRQEITSAIILGNLSPGDYETLTEDDEYQTFEAVQNRLQELWNELYDDDPPLLFDKRLV